MTTKAQEAFLGIWIPGGGIPITTRQLIKVLVV